MKRISNFNLSFIPVFFSVICLSNFCLSTFSAQANTNQVLELNANSKRVAVIVLAFDDVWYHYLGEKIFEDYLRLYVGKYYKKIYITRAPSQTKQMIQENFDEAIKTGLKVDFMSSTHSNEKIIVLNEKTLLTPKSLLEKGAEKASADQLEFAANFGCDSYEQRTEFQKLGFKSFVGHHGTSVGALTMLKFLNYSFHRCENVYQATLHTNDEMLSIIEEGNQIEGKILKMLFGNDLIYPTRLIAAGDDLKLCE